MAYYSKKQEKDIVRDEQGRRRFHGAFTGGFSAGYFNTVGSEEGWTPAAFKSSRSERAKAAPLKPEDFMDKEDDPLLGQTIEARSDYDTLGTGAGSKRILVADGNSAIPGPIPDELIIPAQVSYFSLVYVHIYIFAPYPVFVVGARAPTIQNYFTGLSLHPARAATGIVSAYRRQSRKS